MGGCGLQPDIKTYQQVGLTSGDGRRRAEELKRRSRSDVLLQ